MAVITESVDVNVPIDIADEAWDDFVLGTAIGSGQEPGERRATLRWLRPEQPSDGGTVTFAQIDIGSTRVTVDLAYDDETLGDDGAGLIRGWLREDLRRYAGHAEGRSQGEERMAV